MNTKIPNLHLEPISLEYRLFELYIDVNDITLIGININNITHHNTGGKTMSKPKSLGQQLDDLQTELNRLKELEKLFDKAVKFQLYV